MAEPDPGNHHRPPALVGWSWIIVVTAAGACWALLWKFTWHNPAPMSKASDPSIVLNNFITLYVLFLTGVGILVGFLTGKRQCRKIWKPVAIALLIEVTIVDLWRVLDSTGDLYKAATSNLDSHTLYDIIHDFFAYFAINVFVVMFAVLAACLPRGSPITPAEIWKRMRDWLRCFGGWVHKKVPGRTRADNMSTDRRSASP